MAGTNYPKITIAGDKVLLNGRRVFVPVKIASNDQKKDSPAGDKKDDKQSNSELWGAIKNVSNQALDGGAWTANELWQGTKAFWNPNAAYEGKQTLNNLTELDNIRGADDNAPIEDQLYKLTRRYSWHTPRRERPDKTPEGQWGFFGRAFGTPTPLPNDPNTIYFPSNTTMFIANSADPTTQKAVEMGLLTRTGGEGKKTEFRFNPVQYKGYSSVILNNAPSNYTNATEFKEGITNSLIAADKKTPWIERINTRDKIDALHADINKTITLGDLFASHGNKQEAQRYYIQAAVLREAASGIRATAEEKFAKGRAMFKGVGGALSIGIPLLLVIKMIFGLAPPAQAAPNITIQNTGGQPAYAQRGYSGSVFGGGIGQ